MNDIVIALTRWHHFIVIKTHVAALSPVRSAGTKISDAIM